MVIGIIADDLTGAADSIAPFAHRGYRSEVRFFQRGMWQKSADAPPVFADALAIDTGSRDADWNDNLRDLNFRRATRFIASHAPTVIFKKIDSVLRGHLRVELEAMRSVLPERLPIVCSAFPANGREIVAGKLHLRGEPQEGAVHSAFGYDSENDSRTANVTLAELRRGTESLSARLHDFRRREMACVFCDAATDSDLDILEQAIWREPSTYLPVGSAGLSAAFARQLPLQTRNETEIATLLNVFRTGRVLIAVGSLHPVSREQVRHFCQTAGVRPVLTKSGSDWEFSRKAHQTLTEERFALISTPETQTENALDCSLAYSVLELHKYLAKNKLPAFDALFVTGGDSARQTFKNLNGSGLRIVGEMQPGVVAARLITSEMGSRSFQNLPVLLKSGGFGAVDLLQTILGTE